MSQIFNSRNLSTYIEVDISSAQILAMGTTPIELLPTPGPGKYLDWKLDWELDYGTADYACSGNMKIGANAVVGISLVTERNDAVSQLNSHGLVDSNGQSLGSVNLNTNLEVSATTAVTLGDSTVKVKIWYIIRTFG
jgi:hypothetical protein